MKDDDIINITGLDGEQPTPEDVARAMEETARVKDHEMSCPELDCSGRIEASCQIWFNLSAEGVPYVHGIGWFEGGTITCSLGGDAHVPMTLERQVWETLSQLCASLEKKLGSQTQEDLLPGGDVIWSDDKD